MSLFNRLFGPTTQQLQEVKQHGRLVFICQRQTTMIGIYSVYRHWVEVIVDCHSDSIISLRQIDTEALSKHLPNHWVSPLLERLN